MPIRPPTYFDSIEQIDSTLPSKTVPTEVKCFQRIIATEEISQSFSTAFAKTIVTEIQITENLVFLKREELPNSDSS